MHRAYAWDVIWVFGMIVEWHALQSHEVLLSIRARMNGRFCIKTKRVRYSPSFSFADHRCDDADNDSSTDQTSDSGIRFKDEMVDLSQIHDAPLYFVSLSTGPLAFLECSRRLEKREGLLGGILFGYKVYSI